MAGKDKTRLTGDEKINGIKATKLPDYFRNKHYGDDIRETFAQLSELVIQLGINMGLSPEETLKWARKLQETVSQSEFDSWVSTLLDGGPSIFMNTLSELRTTYPNGAAGVALVRETDPAKIYVWNGSAWEDFGDYQGISIKDKSVTSEKIADGAVTPENTTFLNRKNLFVKSEANDGYYWARVDGKAVQEAIPTLTSNPTYVPVSAGDTFYKNSIGHIFFTTDDGTVLTPTNSQDPAGAYTAPDNAKRMYFNVYMENKETFQIEKGTVGTSYDDGLTRLDPQVKISEQSIPSPDFSGVQPKLKQGKNIIIDQETNEISAQSSEIKKYYRVTSQGDLTVYVPINDTEYASYRFSRNVYEDYMKMNENGIYEKLENGIVYENFDEVKGSLLGTHTSNPYVRVVGEQALKTFNGTGIKVITYSDDRGGVWNITIDGIDQGDYSTWSTAPGISELELANIQGLEDGTHKLVMTFKGSDPQNSPTDGIPRGWLKQKTEGAWEISSKSGPATLKHKFDISETSSNKEFAINVSDVNSTGGEWFPQHNNIGTVNVGSKGVQIFSVDGDEVDLNVTSNEFKPFNKGNFTQVVFAKLPEDNTDRAKIIISYDFDSVVKQYFEMKFLEDTKLNKGYTFMMPLRRDFASQFKTDKREILVAKVVSETEQEPFTNLDAKEFIGTSNMSDKSDYYMRAKITNISHDLKALFLQHRGGQFEKMYPLLFDGDTIYSGQSIYADGEWEVGRMKGANKVYGQ